MAEDLGNKKEDKRGGKDLGNKREDEREKEKGEDRG